MRIGVLFCCFYITFHFSAYAQTETEVQLRIADSIGESFRFAESDSILQNILAARDNSSNAVEIEAQYLQACNLAYRDKNKETVAQLLRVADEAKSNQLHRIHFMSLLQLALIHEKADDLALCFKHLKKANGIAKKHHLKELYAKYCIRAASYFRFANQPDSAVFYARLVLDHASIYRHETDGHLLLGVLLSYTNPEEAITHYTTAGKRFMKRGKYNDAAFMQRNIAKLWLKNDETAKARHHIDLAFQIFRSQDLAIDADLLQINATVFEAEQQLDSTLYYQQLSYSAYKQEEELAGNVAI